jgi:hypothetical protein
VRRERMSTYTDTSGAPAPVIRRSVRLRADPEAARHDDGGLSHRQWGAAHGCRKSLRISRERGSLKRRRPWRISRIKLRRS